MLRKVNSNTREHLLDFAEENQQQSKTLVSREHGLYGALARKGLLREPNDNVGVGRLVREGQLGLSSDNGKAVFLAPGRHILWSPLHTFKGYASISDKKIELNNIQIITIDNSEMGLSKAAGDDILLEPGQHILQSPQNYIESKQINSKYIKLGAHHWISVPIGYVAIAHNQGKKMIITPTELKVDKQHAEYIICTNKEILKLKSPTFQFDEENGFKSIQQEDMQLEKINVNTSEMIPLSVIGSVRYAITDPVRAFLITEDVVGDIKKQAHATLTSVFSRLSIDEIAMSISSTNITHMKDKQEDIPHDMLHHATDMFMHEFQTVVQKWGVDASLINITSLQLLDEKFRETVKARAQQRMEAATQRAIVETQTEAEIKKTERESKMRVMQADASTEVIKRNADAEVYAATKKKEAAEILSDQPLAQQLAIMDKQIAMAEKLGNKTIITDFKFDQYRSSDASGNMLLFSRKENKEKNVIQPMLANDSDKTPPLISSMS